MYARSCSRLHRHDVRELMCRVCVCAGEGQVRLQDPPARNGGTAEEVQRQEEAEGQQSAPARDVSELSKMNIRESAKCLLLHTVH